MQGKRVLERLPNQIVTVQNNISSLFSAERVVKASGTSLVVKPLSKPSFHQSSVYWHHLISRQVPQLNQRQPCCTVIIRDLRHQDCASGHLPNSGVSFGWKVILILGKERAGENKSDTQRLQRAEGTIELILSNLLHKSGQRILTYHCCRHLLNPGH